MCPIRYRTRHSWLAGGPLLRVATIRRTTDTHYRRTLQTHATDTHYRHTLQTHTTDTFLSISHTTNVLLIKYRCNIFIGVRIIKEMPGSVASGTLCIIYHSLTFIH